MMDLKLWFQSDLLKLTKVWLLNVALFIYALRQIIFCHWPYHWARDEGLS